VLYLLLLVVSVLVNIMSQFGWKAATLFLAVSFQYPDFVRILNLNCKFLLQASEIIQCLLVVSFL